MAIEEVKKYFSEYGIENRIKEFDESSATVELAAIAVGCEPCRIAKTLSFMVDGKPILIVTAGDAKVDNQKYKSKYNTKAKMLTPVEENATDICYTISIPVDSADTLFEYRITKLINAKANLLKKVFNIDSLIFEIKDEKITFDWLPPDSPQEMVNINYVAGAEI